MPHWTKGLKETRENLPLIVCVSVVVLFKVIECSSRLFSNSVSFD